MNNRIKSLFLLSLLSGQLRAEDVALLSTASTNKQKVAKKVDQLKEKAKKAVVAIKKHPLITLWGLAGAVLLVEMCVRLKQKIDDERAIRWHSAMQDFIRPQDGALELANAKERRRTNLIQNLDRNLPELRGQEGSQCPLCLESMPAGGVFVRNGLLALHCGHEICHNCLRGTLIAGTIRNRTTGQDRCPTCAEQSNFESSLTEEDVRLVLGGNDAWPFIQSIRQNGAIAAQQGSKQCPTANCSYLLVPQEGQEDFTCPECTGHYCLQCSANHTQQQASCEEIKRARTDEDGTGLRIWLEKHDAKPCPNCSTAIEKNAGCFHMTCRCTYQFCWNCLGPWTGHSNFFRCGLARAN
jgi:hypothetical protein